MSLILLIKLLLILTAQFLYNTYLKLKLKVDS